MSKWRSVNDLPRRNEKRDEETRCIVVWRDAENPSDVGVETSNLFMIRDGDYSGERYAGAVWLSVMDAPPFKQRKNPAAVALGRLGGRKGGTARAKKLSPNRRSEIARKAAKARWTPHQVDDFVG